MTGVRDNKTKPRVELLPPFAMLEIAKGFSAGERKYSACNWMLGGPDLTHMKIVGSLVRHLLHWIMGQEIDEDSKQYWPGGVSHLALVGCNAMMLLELTHLPTGTDDRPCKLSVEQMQVQPKALCVSQTSPEHGTPAWKIDKPVVLLSSEPPPHVIPVAGSDVLFTCTCCDETFLTSPTAMEMHRACTGWST